MFRYIDAYQGKFYFDRLRKNTEFEFHWHYNILEATIKNAYIFQKILENLDQRKPLHILDLGCGNGHVSRNLHKITGANVIGIDPSVSNRIKWINFRRLIRHSKKFNNPVKLLKMNHEEFFKNYKFKSNLFDLIIDNCSVTHFDTRKTDLVNKGWEDVSMNAKRLLKSGGSLISVTDVCGIGEKNSEFLDPNDLLNFLRNDGWKLSQINDFSEPSEWIQYDKYFSNLKDSTFLRLPPMKTLENGLLGIIGFIAKVN